MAKYDELSPEDKKEIIDAFNQKNKVGLELLATKLGTADPDVLATGRARFFIAERDRLDLDDIGNYLTTYNKTNEKETEDNQKTLEEFFNQMEFKGLEFTDALRKFLTAFNLPGEAQKIDKAMEAFAKRYTEENPGKFKNSDAAYTLAFSVIMLNTDLHNSAVEKKITLEGFIKNNQGINEGEDFTVDFLTKIYQEIKVNEMKPNVTKIAPGFTISAHDLAKDKTYRALIEGIKNPSELITRIPGLSRDQSKTHTAQLNKPTTWLHRLMGYEGTIVVKDENQKEVVSIQVYAPGVFSRNKNPKVIIQPAHDASLKAQKAHIEIAASLAASFKHTATVKATYDYAKVNLVEAYHAKRNNSLADERLRRFTRERNVSSNIPREAPPAYEDPPAYSAAPDDALPSYSEVIANPLAAAPTPIRPATPAPIGQPDPAMLPAGWQENHYQNTRQPTEGHQVAHHQKRHSPILEHFKRKKAQGHVEGLQGAKKHHNPLRFLTRKQKLIDPAHQTRTPRPTDSQH